MISNPPFSSLVETAPHSRRERDTAAITGTRCLAQQIQFEQLLDVLVASGAIQVSAAKRLLTGIADEIDASGEHPEWMVHSGEAALQSARMRQKAEGLR